MSSPWENVPVAISEETVSESGVEPLRSWGRTGGIPAVETKLAAEFVEPRATVSLVGAHGGAGTTTLSLMTGMVDGGHSWPVTFPDQANDVVVVCRSNVWGLEAARTAAQSVYSGRIVGVNLLGLVVMADAPGRRRPTELTARIEHVSGAFPRVWSVPWMEALRFGEMTKIPSLIGRVIDELIALNKERGASEC